MKYKYFFQTNLVIEDRESNIITEKIFPLLGNNIIFRLGEQGRDIVMEIESEDHWEIANKFASLLVYRNSNIEYFRYVFHTGFSSDGEINYRGPCYAFIDEDLIMRGNEESFDSKMWQMLSFYMEAINSSSIFYKFICLYKIIEIHNLQPKLLTDGRSVISLENKNLIDFLNNEVPKFLDKEQLDELNGCVCRSKLDNKTIGHYFDHLLRDAFSHTGFLDRRNHYEYGYPTLNPLNILDLKKYNQSILWIKPLAKHVLAINEPKID